MKNISRFVFAVLLIGALAVVSTGVWAASTFTSTVPQPPKDGDNETEVDRRNAGTVGGAGGATQCEDPALVVEMGTAVFYPGGNENCAIEVAVVEDPATESAPAPQGKAFMGDVFKLITENKDVKVCFAYSPDMETKNVKIYKFNAPDWVEVPGAEIADGKICAEGNESGLYALIGDE